MSLSGILRFFKPLVASLFTELFLVSGPEFRRSYLLSHTRFIWDPFTSPCIDGNVSHEGYAVAIEDWCDYHGKVPDSNTNIVPKNLRGLQIQSQLFDPASDFINDIPHSVLKPDDGAVAIVDALHKRNQLSKVVDVF